MAKDYIRISKKHGVNPSIALCAWCGKSKGIALLGKLPEDAEAPREAVFDYEPCDDCHEMWQQGVPVLEVTNIPIHEGMPPINKEPIAYPTGRFVVINPEALVIKTTVGKPVLCNHSDFIKIFEKELPKK